MGKRSRRSEFWTTEHGGMPMWGIVASIMAIAAMFGVVIISPALRGEVTPYVRPSGSHLTPAPSETSEVAAPVVVSLLSDSHAYNTGSWWRRTIVAGEVAGVVQGAFESQPGADAVTLANRLDAASRGDFVLIQAGTNDLLSAVAPADALVRVEALWDGVALRGPSPVAVLVPPSATRPAETVELNTLIAASADARGIPVIDVYTSVTNGDGTWIEGYSGDGIHSLPDGSAVMGQAAQEQLTALLG